MGQPEIIRDEAFGRRFTQICDNHPLCPREGKGRLSWIQTQISYHGTRTTIESIRKWLKGVNKPNRPSMIAISKVFQVDPAWLTHGRSPSDQDDMLPLAQTNGATGVVGGLMKLAGLEPFFLEEGEGADLEVIHRNKRYKVVVALAQISEGVFTFSFPARFEGLTPIGFISTGGIGFSLIKFSLDELKTHGVPHGTEIKLTVDKEGKPEGAKKPIGRPIRDIKADLSV